MLPGKGRGRGADVPAESAREVALIGKADRQRDLAQRKLGLHEQLARAPDPQTLHIGHRSEPGAALEHARKVEAAHIGDGGQVREEMESSIWSSM